jgi:hypothetical protein
MQRIKFESIPNRPHKWSKNWNHSVRNTCDRRFKYGVGSQDRRHKKQSDRMSALSYQSTKHPQFWNDLWRKIWDSGGSGCRWLSFWAHLSELPEATSAWSVDTSDAWRFVCCVDHEIQHGIDPTVLFPTRELRARNRWRKGEGSGPGKWICGNHLNVFRCNLRPGSNESEASDPQFRKLRRLMNYTFRGIAKELIFGCSNARDSIRVNSEFQEKSHFWERSSLLWKVIFLRLMSKIGKYDAILIKTW